MRKILFLTACCILSCGNLIAQRETSVGGQLVYGTELKAAGLGIIAEFNLGDKITLSPSFSFYFPKSETFFKQSAWELNGNINYYFIEEDGLGFYGLGGLNYTSISVKSDLSGLGFGEVKTTDGRVGLNLGAGANFDIGKKILPFGELKYIISDFDRLVIAAGIKYKL